MPTAEGWSCRPEDLDRYGYSRVARAGPKLWRAPSPANHGKCTRLSEWTDRGPKCSGVKKPPEISHYCTPLAPARLVTSGV